MNNVTMDELEGLSRKLTIEVPKDTVHSELDLAYKEIQKQVTLPGFRKGKAPISKIKPLYKDKVQQEVINNLITDAYSAALKEHDQSPISHPQINVEKFEDGETFKFTATFEIRPTVEIKAFEGLTVQKEKFEPSSEQVDQTLENMQQSKSETVPVLEDRPAQLGDISNINFDGTVEGQPLEGGNAKDFQLELGSNSFIPGFEEGIVGMTIGSEKELTLKFPEEYHAADIAGKNVIFKVKLNKLEKKSLPELTDEFAASVGEEGITTLDELKTRIREDLHEGEQKRIEDELRIRVIRSLVEVNPVLVPKSLLEEQKTKLVQDTVGRLKQQGMNEAQIEDYKTKWDEEFNKSASFMIQSSFLIDKLATDLNLKASAADVDAKIEEYAQKSGLELDKIKSFYDKPEMRSQMSFQITEEKVVTQLLETAKIEEVSKDQLKDEEL